MGVWCIDDWRDEYDATGKALRCVGYKDSSSSPFLEYRIEGTMSGYHVHVASTSGANVICVRYKDELSNHASGRNILGRDKSDTSCNFGRMISFLSQRGYHSSADMVRRLKSAYESFRAGSL